MTERRARGGTAAVKEVANILPQFEHGTSGDFRSPLATELYNHFQTISVAPPSSRSEPMLLNYPS